MNASRCIARRSGVAQRGGARRATAGLSTLALALVAATGGAADLDEKSGWPGVDAPARAVEPLPVGDDELIIPEVFHSHLPNTLKKEAVRVWVHPKLGDLISRDHLRIAIGLRYGLTGKWEVSASSDLYFSHGFGDVRAFDRFGAANLELGMKLNLGRPIFSGWDTAVGFEYQFPTGRPPAELTDGLRHFRPYVTFSHRLANRGNFRFFWGLRMDQVSHTSLGGEFGRNDFRDSSTGITGGVVIDRNNLHYTFEASYDTTRLIGHTEAEVFRIRPGIIWEIHSQRDPGKRSNWVVGTALTATHGPGGASIGGSLKLRYNLGLKALFRSR
jgi:hypothetical protein